MELYEEKKRERRRRDFRRVVERSVARMRREISRPEDLAYLDPCATWDDVHRTRRRLGRYRAEHARQCSCSWYGNTRRIYGDRTFREYRQALAAMEQSIESRLRDDEPGRRRLKWRGPWP